MTSCHTDCAISGIETTSLNQAIANGCNSALIQTIGEIGSDAVGVIISDLIFDQTTDIGIPINLPGKINPSTDWKDFFFSEDPLRSNPLQIAASASSITYHGLKPAPKILSAVDTSEAGWVFLSGESLKAGHVPGKSR